MTTSPAPVRAGTPSREGAGRTLMRAIGMYAGLVGSAGGLLGSLWHVLLPTPDANIGAGALVVMGFLLSLGAGAMLALRLLLNRGATIRSRT